MPRVSLLTESERFERLRKQQAVNQKKWCEKNKEKLRINATNYYNRNKHDPEFLKKFRKKPQNVENNSIKFEIEFEIEEIVL